MMSHDYLIFNSSNNIDKNEQEWSKPEQLFTAAVFIINAELVQQLYKYGSPRLLSYCI